MRRTISKILLVAGLLAIAGGILWGYKEGVFDFSRTGAGIGLTRVFLFLFYMPIAIGLTISGCIPLLKGWVTRSNLMKRVGLAISLLLFVIAISFVLFNVAGNIRNYEGAGLLWVVSLNLVFTLPLLFLSGLFFFLSQLKS